jgi:hypothetical protein
VRRLQSSNWTTSNPEDNNNSKGKQKSLRKAATRNITSDYPSPNLRKTLQAIPILPAIPIIQAPVTQTRASPIHPVEAAVPTYHQRRGSKRKSTKADRQTGNALAVAVETTQPTFVPNTASQAHLNRTPAITAAMMANKSSAKSHSTCSSKKPSLPLSIPNSTGEAGRDGVRIGKLGEPGRICNLG